MFLVYKLSCYKIKKANSGFPAGRACIFNAQRAPCVITICFHIFFSHYRQENRLRISELIAQLLTPTLELKGWRLSIFEAQKYMFIFKNSENSSAKIFCEREYHSTSLLNN